MIPSNFETGESNMEDNKAERQRLARIILDCERKIVAWTSKQSKSDLEAWKKELVSARAAYKVLKSEKKDETKHETI